MSNKILTVLFLLMLIPFFSFAQDSVTVKKIPDAKTPELKFIGYYFVRGTLSDISPTNELLRGQIIGRLFGSNTTNTSDKTVQYVEQRFVPMLIYTPSILDGAATFRSLFKIDMTWGDAAYGVGGNAGAAINAGQVNLQTLLANVEVKPTDNDWHFVLGLQRMFDNVRDPNVTAVNTAMTSGYKLCFWGTQAPGLNFFTSFNQTNKLRLGYFLFYEDPTKASNGVSLYMIDEESRIQPLLEVGANAWYVRDQGKNAGGISVLGQGLNSALAEYNGAVRISLPTQKYEANIYWLGAHASYNRDFLEGRWWADGFLMSNFGNVDTVSDISGNAGSYGTILSAAANGMLSYRYGMTANDKISIEGIFTTGDDNGMKDKKLSSVITGNVWGSPTAIYSSHHSLLLFPDAQVVSRYFSAVQDISNMGFGVTAGFLTFSKDFVPNKFNGKVTLASAVSNVAPKGGTSYMGTEINLELKYNIKVYLTVGLSAGYLHLGDFYKSPAVKYDNSPSIPKDPFVVFTSLSWLMF